jgi:hypothetical protein
MTLESADIGSANISTSEGPISLIRKTVGLTALAVVEDSTLKPLLNYL